MEAAGELALDTANALSLIGLNRKSWDHMMQLGHYPAAPPVKAGHPRWFTVDDLIGLFVFDHFSRLGLTQPIAGATASAVRRAMDKLPDAPVLWVVTTREGKPVAVIARVPDPDMTAYQIPIETIREEVLRALSERQKAVP